MGASESRQVQFILFYLCQFEVEFAVGFLEQLVKISTMPSTPALVRNASLKYAAGFVSRAKYIRNSTVLWCVDIILTWAAQYVSFFDERSGHTGTIPAHELSSHQCFYTALQSVFYIFIHK